MDVALDRDIERLLGKVSCHHEALPFLYCCLLPDPGAARLCWLYHFPISERKTPFAGVVYSSYRHLSGL